jgi:hypothetical protein
MKESSIYIGEKNENVKKCEKTRKTLKKGIDKRGMV